MSEKKQNIEISIVETQKEKEKQEFIDFLENWVDISSSNDFSKIQENIDKYELSYNLWSTNFDLISPNNKPFVLKKVNSWFNIYAKNDNFISRYFRRNSNVPRLAWIIDSNWKFENFEWNEIYKENEYSSWETFDRRINLIWNETKKELEDLMEQMKLEQEKRELEEKAKLVDQDYTIEKWDSLWKIVKEKYSITDNREIANTINALVRYNSSLKKIKKDINPKDGIKWDIIIVWKTIKLPHTLIVLWKDVLRK